jgi:signal transduction histidine kinase
VIIDDLWGDVPWLQAAWEGSDAELVEQMRSVHSWLGVPLIAKGELIGVLRIDHVEPRHFTQHHAQQVLAFANQAAIAIENARLYEQAQRAAAIEERQRLSRELHDSVSQALYGIVLGARTAFALLERDPQAAADPLRYVLSLGETALAEMRALIFELRPDSLATEGLVPALSRQMDLIGARHRLAMDAELGDEPTLPLNVKETLYRIAQEALNNIARHAQAQRVVLRLRSELDGVTLEISDDGRGFDVSAPHAGHLGLQSIRERAERLGGTCLIQSIPGQGATVRIYIPA